RIRSVMEGLLQNAPASQSKHPAPSVSPVERLSAGPINGAVRTESSPTAAEPGGPPVESWPLVYPCRHCGGNRWWDCGRNDLYGQVKCATCSPPGQQNVVRWIVGTRDKYEACNYCGVRHEPQSFCQKCLGPHAGLAALKNLPRRHEALEIC